MKKSIFAAFLALAIATTVAATSDHAWRIEYARLSPQGEGSGRFTATISKPGGGENYQLDSHVPLTTLGQYFVEGNKLVLLGDAEAIEAVVVFDLSSKRVIDWFYCYAPQRVWDHWIVYVELSPTHPFQNRFTDVVLLYDVSKSPLANRMGERASPVPPPSPGPNGPTRVGAPVYPEYNAAHQSYDNLVMDQADVRLVLGGPGFLPMPNERLVFVVSEEPGGDANTISDRLVVVDLSNGAARAVIRNVSIPEATLKRNPYRPGYVKVNGLQTVPPNTVRLSVSEQDYGVDSILVDISGS